LIRGIGIDIVRSGRLELWLSNRAILERFFHDQEIADVFARGDGRLFSLAARFAAKEAYGKALGTGIAGFSLRDVQVANDGNGKPEVVLHGDARKALERLGGSRVFLSLAHERDNAVAVVVIEGSDLH